MILMQENIKKIVQDYFKDKPVNEMYLFGSYARGDAREDSDVDLTVEIDDTSTRLSLFDFMKLQLGSEESLNKKVDLVESHLFFPRVKSARKKKNLYCIKDGP
jgi:uncharacterized protein